MQSKSGALHDDAEGRHQTEEIRKGSLRLIRDVRTVLLDSKANGLPNENWLYKG